MEHAYNGWPASPNPADFGGLEQIVVAGESFAPGVRAGDVATVLRHVAEQMNARVEPIVRADWHQADDWGYAYRKNRNANNLSCHSAGCAIDYNATLHPNGKRGTFSPDQVSTIRAILNEVDGVVEWGGNFKGTPDEMHLEICGTEAEVARVAARLRGAPAPTPSPWREIPMGASTGLHTRGEQVRKDQADLIDTGFEIAGGADGYAGPATIAVIQSFQTAAGLVVDGIMGPRTRDAIHRVPSWSQVNTLAIQRRLGQYGWRLVLDGKNGPKTKAAVKAFQSRFNLAPDGVVGPLTWTALFTR